MYGWTDPNDPDAAARRAEPPRDEPAWLSDRPEPRSAYLFGDDPEQPAEEWHRDQPTQGWSGQPTDGWRDQPTGQWSAEPSRPWADEPTAGRSAEPTSGTWSAEPTSGTWSAEPATGTWSPELASGSWAAEPATGNWAAEPATEQWSAEPNRQTWAAEPATGGWSGEPDGGWSAGHPGHGPAYGDRAADALTEAGTYGAPFAAAGQSDAEQAGGEGRHRSPRRFPRPLLIGGAAAAATLVVSLGVGALALPGGGGEAADPTAVDDTVATAPELTTDETAPGQALVAPSPTASPTTARPTPSPSRTSKSTPAPSRTTAPSRRSERSSAPSSTGTKAPLSGNVSAQAREVVDLVNAERAKAGCKALSIDDKLMTAAQRHSQDQADHQNMSHTGSDGSDSGDRLDRVGYAWRTYGENVAWNQKTPAAVMDAWMNSSGHRANILNCAFTEIGVGIASSNGPYWTQVFAAPR
ncbi:CAP domain-containing protein [Micromonospora sp. NPDC094482]|uniref:CAP domain-containing protein n=1 Tax=unclassified Micromonospora TaxID=2617518 RepID=UPI0033336450